MKIDDSTMACLNLWKQISVPMVFGTSRSKSMVTQIEMRSGFVGIDAVLRECGVDDYYFTLDGNEQYRSVAAFRAFWERITNETSCSPHMAHLLFVEQPFHRQMRIE